MSYAESNERLRVLLPDENLEVCEEEMELFFSMMFERQEIYYKRFILKEKAPWTENKIFQEYKFTNVYRELDRNSQYQIENVIKYHTEGRIELIWRLMLFRFFNRPEFFEFILELTSEAENNGYEEYGFVGKIPPYNSFNSDNIKEFMTAFRDKGENPFTTAYLTNSQACPGETRDNCFAFKVLPALHALIPKLNKVLISAKEPEEIINLLITLPSVSNFMAHEFYQDFTYVPRYSQTGMKLMKFDQDDYTNVGPGADAGIRWIFPNRKTGKDKLQAIYDLRDIAVDYLAQFGEFKYLGFINGIGYHWDKKNPKITLHQIEMWLCEFQKYKKMEHRIGKQRSKFVPTTKVKKKKM